MAECALCRENRELKNSHIIPRFVFKWLKKTGATPFLRKAVDPDNRIQDYHEKLLCGECEQKLSNFEGKFASQIFYPYIRGQADEFEYDEWLRKFIISISWRLAVSDLASWDDYEEPKQESIKEVESIWREILLGNRSLADDPSTHHLIFLDELDIGNTTGEIPDSFEMYIMRGTDGTSVYSDDEVHYYFKFPRMLFFSCIDPPNPGGFTNTEVKNSGTTGMPHILGEKWGTFLLRRIQELASPKMSKSESNKVTDWIKKNPERFLESDTLETHNAEMRRKWAEHDLIEHLEEEECSVCYTNHRILKSLPDSPLSRSHVRLFNEKLPFAKATFPDEAEVGNHIPNVTDTLVLSTKKSTMIVQYFANHGWIVGEEIEHHDRADPQEVGQAVWEQYSEEFREWIEQEHG